MYVEAPMLLLERDGNEIEPEMMLDKTHTTKVSYEAWSNDPN
jgi:hypothetical protein